MLANYVCEKCQVIANLVMHYHGYNKHEYVCPVCKNDKCKELNEISVNMWRVFNDNLKALSNTHRK